MFAGANMVLCSVHRPYLTEDGKKEQRTLKGVELCDGLSLLTLIVRAKTL